MGWAVGERDGRWIGYGVPATCDHPGCGKDIDRGISYACGGGVTGSVDNCGLFFCNDHHPHFVEDDDPNGGGDWVCDRCANDEPSFDPTPDTAEWIDHVLTDDSWQRWRHKNPGRVSAMREQIGATP